MFERLPGLKELVGRFVFTAAILSKVRFAVNNHFYALLGHSLWLSAEQDKTENSYPNPDEFVEKVMPITWPWQEMVDSHRLALS